MSDWQLYDLPGRDAANAEFDAAMLAVKIKLQAALDEAEKTCSELCGKHSKLGACDGDTSYMWDRKIVKILKEYHS